MIFKTGKITYETKDLRSKSVLLSSYRVGSARSHTVIVFLLRPYKRSRGTQVMAAK
jgi:hypothetical protein